MPGLVPGVGIVLGTCADAPITVARATVAIVSRRAKKLRTGCEVLEFILEFLSSLLKLAASLFFAKRKLVDLFAGCRSVASCSPRLVRLPQEGDAGACHATRARGHSDCVRRRNVAEG